MIYKRECAHCGEWFTTRSPRITTDSWDCLRMEAVKKHPILALKDKQLAALVYREGYEVTVTHPGGICITRRTASKEPWRDDVARIQRHAKEQNRHLTRDQAWYKAAKEAMRRIEQRYPSNRLDLIKRKQVETSEDGELIG